MNMKKIVTVLLFFTLGFAALTVEATIDNWQVALYVKPQKWWYCMTSDGPHSVVFNIAGYLSGDDPHTLIYNKSCEDQKIRGINFGVKGESFNGCFAANKGKGTVDDPAVYYLYVDGKTNSDGTGTVTDFGQYQGHVDTGGLTCLPF